MLTIKILQRNHISLKESSRHIHPKVCCLLLLGEGGGLGEERLRKQFDLADSLTDAKPRRGTIRRSSRARILCRLSLRSNDIREGSDLNQISGLTHHLLKKETIHKQINTQDPTISIIC